MKLPKRKWVKNMELPENMRCIPYSKKVMKIINKKREQKEKNNDRKVFKLLWGNSNKNKKIEARYEIVKVVCPEVKCPIRICNKQSECRYGDTKEQLINKIKTIYIKCLFDKNKRSVDDIAKDIVEYLGIK